MTTGGVTSGARVCRRAGYDSGSFGCFWAPPDRDALPGALKMCAPEAGIGGKLSHGVILAAGIA